MPLLESDRPLSVASALALRATVEPGAEYLLSDRERVTFGQQDSRAEALAASLSQLGLVSGERLAIVLPPCPEFATTVFAAAKLGLTIVPLNPRLTREEFRYLLRHSEAAAAVCIETYRGEDYLELFEGMMAELPALRHLLTVGEEDLWHGHQVFQFEDLVSAGAGRDYPESEIDPARDVFALLYTSGSAGKQKGVELTHGNMLAAAEAIAEAVGLTSNDRVAGMTGLFHVFGLGPSLLGCLVSGASLVLQEEFDAAETLDLVERFGATVLFGAPSLFAAELNEMERRPRALGSLRLGLLAGATAGDGLIRAIEGALCPSVLVAYSITEGGGAVTVTRPEDPLPKRRFTVGRPLSGVELAILDADGARLPAESVGDIALRGPSITGGYYRQPAETRRSVTVDEFLLTGDVGMLDEEGFLHLVGRRSDVIIRGGFSVYPHEIEARLHAHPAIQDVAVLGVRDRELGEAVHACIIPVEGAMVTGRELRDWCSAAMAGYKVPDRVSFMDSFPRGSSGTVRRPELARMVLAERGGQTE